MADDGSVNAEKLTEAITKVLTDVPQLKGTQNTDGNNGGVTKIGGEGNGGSPEGESVLRGIFGIKQK